MVSISVAGPGFAAHPVPLARRRLSPHSACHQPSPPRHMRSPQLQDACGQCHCDSPLCPQLQCARASSCNCSNSSWHATYPFNQAIRYASSSSPPASPSEPWLSPANPSAVSPFSSSEHVSDHASFLPRGGWRGSSSWPSPPTGSAINFRTSVNASVRREGGPSKINHRYGGAHLRS